MCRISHTHRKTKCGADLSQRLFSDVVRCPQHIHRAYYRGCMSVRMGLLRTRSQADCNDNGGFDLGPAFLSARADLQSRTDL
jgi:hypothetical protein